MMYDFTIPQFIAGSPFTFAFKFLMAYTAGCVVGKSKDKIAPARIITAGVLGQLCYIVLYIGKKFITYHFLHGEPLNVTLAACGTSLLTSLVLLAVAIVIELVVLSIIRARTIKKTKA